MGNVMIYPGKHVEEWQAFPVKEELIAFVAVVKPEKEYTLNFLYCSYSCHIYEQKVREILNKF